MHSYVVRMVHLPESAMSPCEALTVNLSPKNWLRRQRKVSGRLTSQLSCSLSNGQLTKSLELELLLICYVCHNSNQLTKKERRTTPSQVEPSVAIYSSSVVATRGHFSSLARHCAIVYRLEGGDQCIFDFLQNPCFIY